MEDLKDKLLATIDLIESGEAEIFCNGREWRELTKVPDALVYFVRNNCIRRRCRDCGGEGYIEPESGDSELDKPYPCPRCASKEVGTFLKKVQEAHKNAGNSTLCFKQADEPSCYECRHVGNNERCRCCTNYSAFED